MRWNIEYADGCSRTGERNKGSTDLRVHICRVISDAEWCRSHVGGQRLISDRIEEVNVRSSGECENQISTTNRNNRNLLSRKTFSVDKLDEVAPYEREVRGETS